MDGRLSFMMQPPVSRRHLSLAAMLLMKTVCVHVFLGQLSRERYSALSQVTSGKLCEVHSTVFILTAQVKTEDIFGLVPFFPFAES